MAAKLKKEAYKSFQEFQNIIDALLEKVPKELEDEKILKIFETEPPLSRYLFTAKNLPLKNVIKTTETSSSIVYFTTNFQRVFDIFLGMCAEGGDAFGFLYNYPRTAYITSDLYIMKNADKMPPSEEKNPIENATALYPGDLDQIIAHCYFSAEMSYLPLPTGVYFFVILKVQNVDRDEKRIRGNANFIIYSNHKYDDIKSESNNIYKNITEIVFGKGWNFIYDRETSPHTYNIRITTSPTGLFFVHGDESAKVLALLELIRRNWPVKSTYVNRLVHEIDEFVTKNVYKSFALGFIPFIIPKGPQAINQISAAPKIGEVTAERLRFIFTPQSFGEDKWKHVRAPYPTMDARGGDNDNDDDPVIYKNHASHNTSPPLRLTLSSYNPHHALDLKFPASHNKMEFESVVKH